jgi:L-serine dehydratase
MIVSSFLPFNWWRICGQRRTHQQEENRNKMCFPYPIEKAAELLTICKTENKSISEIVYENENRCAPKQLSIMN